MILGFRQKFTDGSLKGRPTLFKEKILALITNRVPETGPDLFSRPFMIPKIHTMRGGDRWRAGRIIQMAYGVRTKYYDCFNRIDSLVIPDLEMCMSTQKVDILWTEDPVTNKPHVYIDNILMSDQKVDELALNDGFESTADFFVYFAEDFHGQVIHWTKQRY